MRGLLAIGESSNAFDGRRQCADFLFSRFFAILALIAFSAVPAMLSGPATAGLSASATGNLNSSKSDTHRVNPKDGKAKAKCDDWPGDPCCCSSRGNKTCCHSDPN